MTEEVSRGNLLPQDHECRMRVFTLRQGLRRFASGVVFSDGRVAVGHTTGKEEVFPTLDHLIRDYAGTAGLVWEDDEPYAPRRFVFIRDADSTGFSGTGWAMEGAQFPDGRVLLTWLGEVASLVHWDSIELAAQTHGHGGDTRLLWVDDAMVRGS